MTMMMMAMVVVTGVVTRVVVESAARQCVLVRCDVVILIRAASDSDQRE